MESIFKYTDYRTFLKDYLAEKQKENKRFSLGSWAKLLGLSSTAVLGNIINGKRNLGDKLVNNFIDYFNFGRQEEQYFIDLVSLYKVKNDPSISLALMEKIVERHGLGEDVRFFSDEEFQAIANWYYTAIREMVSLPYFKEDYEWIASNLYFDVTPEEIKEAIETLLELKFIERDSDGKLQSSRERLAANADYTCREAIKRYTLQTVENAMLCPERVDSGEGFMVGKTFNIDEASLPQFRQLVGEFHEKVSQLLEKQDGSRTYQLNVQVYPLNRKES